MRSAVLDGEVVALERAGRPRFNHLFFHRAAPVFVAFALLALNGQDLRGRPLLERKRVLRRIVPARSNCVLYADHVAGSGRNLVAAVVEQDS
jgi:bifunctional non-homologous end joining protein LigD